MRYPTPEAALLALRADLKLVRDGLSTATYRAINTALARGRTRAVRIMRRTYELPDAEFREGIAVKKAARLRLAGRLKFSGSRSIPLHTFNAQGGYDGVTVKVLRAAGRKVVFEGFMATMQSGHKGVFHRTGKPARVMRSGNYKGQVREPIDEMWGPSPLAVWEKEENAAELYGTIQSAFDAELSRQAEYLLTREGIR